MAKLVLTIVVCLAGIVGSSYSQEVVITGFPAGVGGSVGSNLFQPYYPGLKAVADTLHNNPAARAVITGGADGIEYHQDHDAKNPALALGRAHVLRNILVVELGVDSTRIIIITQETEQVGDAYRFASVRVVREPVPEIAPNYDDRIKALENRPPVEKHFTEVKEVPTPFVENLGLQASAGIGTSPFGGMPTVAAAVTWKRFLLVEGFFGHSFWTRHYRFAGADLDTRRRLAGGLAVLYPRTNVPVGVVAGWVRIEEISQLYYDYVRMSEGPMLGLRALPIKYISVTAAWNPSHRRVAGSELSQYKNGQFLLSIMAQKTFGGGK